MKLYDTRDTYWLGNVYETGDDSGFSSPWTPCAQEPPPIESGQYLRILGGEWIVTEEPPPEDVWLQRVIEDECARITASKEDVKATDFAYNFGSGVMAQLDDGSLVQAGVRSLQMKPINRSDWKGQQLRALAATVLGDTSKVIVARASDNANVLCSPAQWLACFEAGAARDEAFMLYAVARKKIVRACTSEEAVAATRAATDAGWATVGV